MRIAAGSGLGLTLVILCSAAAKAMVGMPLPQQTHGAPGVTKVEYFCSPGFEPSYGGTCVAVPPRAEIELFVDQPIYALPVAPAPPRLRYRRHRVLHERY